MTATIEFGQSGRASTVVKLTCSRWKVPLRHINITVTRLRYALAATALLLTAVTCGRSAQRRIPEQTTLCSIMAAPQSFDGHWVKVRAHIRTDGIEHTGLHDAR